MPKQLERALEGLQRELLAQCRAVEGAILAATESLRQHDAERARAVIAGDPAIDQAQNRLEEQCLEALALHQPVAIDLRRIVAALMISTDLERMGDLAEEIAERALDLGKGEALLVSGHLERMADLTTLMVRQAIASFVGLDTRLARAVCRLDDEVDRYNREIIGEIVAALQGRPDLIEAGLSLFSATRHLERIADHATN